VAVEEAVTEVVAVVLSVVVVSEVNKGFFFHSSLNLTLENNADRKL
jgi:hypothetical protein